MNVKDRLEQIIRSFDKSEGLECLARLHEEAEAAVSTLAAARADLDELRALLEPVVDGRVLDLIPETDYWATVESCEAFERYVAVIERELGERP